MWLTYRAAIFRHFYGLSESLLTPHHAAFSEMVVSVMRELIRGVYSGNFYLDPQGTWNGSSFTITVNDSVPHFFHAITPWWESDCSHMANLSIQAQFPDTVDELF